MYNGFNRKLTEQNKETLGKSDFPQVKLSVRRIGKMGVLMEQGNARLVKELLQWLPERLN
jgi:hypothetical protein